MPMCRGIAASARVTNCGLVLGHGAYADADADVVDEGLGPEEVINVVDWKTSRSNSEHVASTCTRQ